MHQALRVHQIPLLRRFGEDTEVLPHPPFPYAGYLKPRAEEERRIAAEEKKKQDERKRIERELAEGTGVGAQTLEKRCCFRWPPSAGHGAASFLPALASGSSGGGR